jgi:phosphoenolpyruvate synthase/pyruvate phosphate dikinase
VKHVAASGGEWEKGLVRYVRRFHELGRGDIDLAGGKGANLGELTRAGLPVPPGFVLTTAAYRAFVAGNDLDEQVLAPARLPPDAETGRYDGAADRIRSLFADAPVPAELGSTAPPTGDRSERYGSAAAAALVCRSDRSRTGDRSE